MAATIVALDDYRARRALRGAPPAPVTRLADRDLTGYVPGHPWPFSDGPDADARTCAAATCERCGHAGLDYRPYRGLVRTDRSFGVPSYPYRAFAVCPICAHCEEF